MAHETFRYMIFLSRNHLKTLIRYSAKMMVTREDLETGEVFLSTKINKIRWHPSKFTYKDGIHTGIFAVGSYDETV